MVCSLFPRDCTQLNHACSVCCCTELTRSQQRPYLRNRHPNERVVARLLQARCGFPPPWHDLDKLACNSSMLCIGTTQLHNRCAAAVHGLQLVHYNGHCCKPISLHAAVWPRLDHVRIRPYWGPPSYLSNCHTQAERTLCAYGYQALDHHTRLRPPLSGVHGAY